MEYLVVIIASILAGVGTGLVGLSAATAMVPLLIVLCPTFRGEHGAYMATAIALASDILGSAVTTHVYAKNKKIDLKHGWIMTACIISMCAVGSVAAFFTHQQVLGGFSLFLCVAIGIRFLVKPDSKKKESVSALHKLTIKEIAVSLFFGLTIGFGTGFFGSGGGMMMLIVFTAFLGYDRKTAVGTSTFIMTFTALIASVSHILIEPAIILECWDYLLIAIVTATTFSLLSAQFANKVKGKIVGIVTGVILLGLGLSMITLNYWGVISKNINMTLLSEFGRVLGLFLAIIIAMATVLIIIRYTTKVPGYVFRKLLHIVAMLAIFPLLFLTDIWWIAVAVDVASLIMVIIALQLVEKCKFYDGLFQQKGKHEVIISFVCLFSMIGTFIALCWGLLGPECKYMAAAAMMAWGPGDGMAAIVGITWGKKKLSGKMIEGTKTVEGTVAMGVTSFICTAVTLVLLSEMAWYIILPASLVIGVIAAFTELFTKKGWDTITVPMVSLAVLLAVGLLSGMISTDENVVPDVTVEEKLLLQDTQNGLEIYGLTEDDTERIRLIYKDEDIDIDGAFSNIYEETPGVCIKDIDGDSVDEIILAVRRHTGTKRTYDLYICDKKDDWTTSLYTVTQEEILTMISYQYDETDNTIMFKETGGEEVEVLLPEWSDKYPFTGDVSFADEYFYDVSNMTLEVIPQIRMTDSLPYKPLGIVFDVQYADGAFTLKFRKFEQLISEESQEEMPVNQQEEATITSITPLSDDEMEITFSYVLNGETKTHSFTSVRMPDLGLEPQDRAHVELIDMNGDGTSEVVCKVYYIGNTFTELCGDLYVYQATESGLESVLSLGTDYGVPDARWITATYSTDTALYVETGAKRWEDGELYTDPIFYRVECIEGAWLTKECELPETELQIW